VKKRSALKTGQLHSRLLAVLLLGIFGLTIWADRSSELAAPLREQRPIALWLSARFSGQGRVVPPALYLALYAPAAHSLDLTGLDAATETTPGNTLADAYGEAYIPAGNTHGAAATMARQARTLVEADPAWQAAAFAPHLQVELAAGARPAFPREMKQQLSALIRRPGFWLQAPRLIPAGLSTYDAWLIARELRSLPPERIFLSVLPEAPLRGRFLSRLFGRASGEAGAKPTIEVLNASKVPGVALKATKVLRFRGFDVVHFGNAPAKKASVRVFDRAGNPEAARRVLAALGCPNTEVVTVMETDPEASVSVILGESHRDCKRLSD
jgi:hypothetical protein